MLLQIQIYSQGFCLTDDYCLDLQTLEQQQSQDPVLKVVYYWVSQNTKTDSVTPQITGTQFLHAYFEIFFTILCR